MTGYQHYWDASEGPCYVYGDKRTVVDEMAEAVRLAVKLEASGYVTNTLEHNVGWILNQMNFDANGRARFR